MTLSEVVANIARKLGNRTDLDAAIADEVRLAQIELEAARQLPWFLLDEEQYIDIAAETDRLALPTGFLREYEKGALWRYDADVGKYQKLVKLALDDLRDVTADTEDDSDTVPMYYALAGKYFHLAPVPGDTVRLQILCYTRDDTLTLDGDTNDFLTYNPELLLAKAGMRMAQWLQNPGAFAMFQSQYVEAATAQEAQNTAREMENFEAEMGGL